MRFHVLSTLIKLTPLTILHYVFFYVKIFFFIMVRPIVFSGPIGLNNCVIKRIMGYSFIINIFELFID